MKTQIIAQLLAVAGVATALDARVARPHAVQIRSDPAGFVTEDDTWKYFSAGRSAKTSGGGSSGVTATSMTAFEDGNTVSCLPVYGNMDPADCDAAIAQIASNSGSITVEAATCRNWEVGTCLARVCAEDAGAYSQSAQSIAQTLAAEANGVCVPKGDSAVVSDCADYASSCGTFRLWLVNESSVEDSA